MPIDRKLALLSQKLVGSHKASRPINGSEGWTDLLFLFIIHSCPQLGKTLLADGMLHPTGVPLRGGKADACAKEHFGKKAMAFIDADSDGTTSIRQAETVAFIDRYCQELCAK